MNTTQASRHVELDEQIVFEIGGFGKEGLTCPGEPNLQSENIENLNTDLGR